MSVIEIKVPDIGDFDEVAVIELLVKPGDSVAAEQSLITVESDKASMEIPSSAAGVVKELKVKLGDKVKEGSVVLLLEAAGATTAPAAAPVSESKQVAATALKHKMLPKVEAPKVAAGDALVEVRVPDIGDFKDVAVIEVMVKAGDTVKMEQSLITVESDKASMEIPSSAAGVIKDLRVKLGDKLNIGDLLAVVQGVSPAAAPAPAAPAPTAAAAAPVAAATTAPAAAAATTAAAMPPHDPTALQGRVPHASPSVRKFARELGVPLAEVKGSGPKGRITQDDVQGFTRSVMAGAMQTQAQAARTPAGGGSDGAALGLIPWPKVDFTKFGTVERKDLSRIKKLSGANLHRNWVMIPHVTNNDEADITDLEAFRVATNKENEKSGVKVTMLAFVIKAVVGALKKFPDFNASLDGDALVYKQYFNVGFAADTPNGLVVPVLKDADKKGILQISAEMGELARKARDGKLGSADMQGGCISISSLGGIGGTHFTPIINAPEVAILGLSRSAMKPQWDGKQFVPRLVLPLSLSYDHRVIDGAAAARFNAYLGQVLADFRRVPSVTTVVVVKKAGQAAIAADTLVTFGDTRLGHRFEANSKLFKVDTLAGSSYVGVAGTVAHFPVLRKAMTALPQDQLKLGSRDEVFDTFTKLHPMLKETFFLQTKEDDNDPYESSQFSVVIANASGIYGLYSYREVFEFKEFWGIGSGRSFALGAMHASWDKAKTAREIATIGVHAGCEFDKNSAGPVEVFTIKLKQ